MCTKKFKNLGSKLLSGWKSSTNYVGTKLSKGYTKAKSKSYSPKGCYYNLKAGNALTWLTYLGSTIGTRAFTSNFLVTSGLTPFVAPVLLPIAGAVYLYQERKKKKKLYDFINNGRTEDYFIKKKHFKKLSLSNESGEDLPTSDKYIISKNHDVSSGKTTFNFRKANNSSVKYENVEIKIKPKKGKKFKTKKEGKVPNCHQKAINLYNKIQEIKAKDEEEKVEEEEEVKDNLEDKLTNHIDEEINKVSEKVGKVHEEIEEIKSIINNITINSSNEDDDIDVGKYVWMETH